MDVGTEHLKNLVRELYCRNGYSVFSFVVETKSFLRRAPSDLEF